MFLYLLNIPSKSFFISSFDFILHISKRLFIFKLSIQNDLYINLLLSILVSYIIIDSILLRNSSLTKNDLMNKLFIMKLIIDISNPSFILINS